jgi:hypothetical protein
MTDEPFLTIASGLQEGARIRLPRGENVVGSDPACSVVVADPTFVRNRLRVAVTDVVEIQGNCRIVLSDGAVVMPGEVFGVESSCSFTAGETLFKLELSEDELIEAKKKARRWRPLPSVAAGVVTLTGFALLGAIIIGSGAPERSDAAVVSSHPALSAEPAAELAVVFLRQCLDDASLPGLLVTPRADGAIVVSGVLAPAHRNDWAAIRQQYDQRFGTARVLVEQFDAPSLLPSVHIAAVWSGSNPYMIDDHGSRLSPGASLGDGWSIEKIDDLNIVVRQGTRRVALKY